MRLVVASADRYCRTCRLKDVSDTTSYSSCITTTMYHRTPCFNNVRIFSPSFANVATPACELSGATSQRKHSPRRKRARASPYIYNAVRSTIYITDLMRL